MKGIYLKGAIISFVIAGIIIGCGGGGGSVDTTVRIDSSTLVSGVAPASITVTGTSLDETESDSCGTSSAVNTTTTITKRNISSSNGEDGSGGSYVGDPEDLDSYNLNDSSRESVNSHNTIERMTWALDSKKSNGDDAGIGKVHPLLISYNEQVKGDYEMGDGSADIGDPEHVDGVFLSVSLDNGTTWKKYEITNTYSRTTDELKSSIQVQWDGKTIDYPAHAQKPTMAVEDNKIIVAWNDKYCPSQDPLDVETDYFGVNGKQSYIDYDEIVAPNGKTVYQVPFSCVWTSRGIMDETTGEITWQTPMQLTTGMRDSNHIWIEGSEVGFAMAWQEDTEGLRSGKGAGPGEGWSGATTNHGTDIWYSSIKMDDFENDTVNFNYPVRITDNETCSTNDNKLYCQYMCEEYGFASLITGNNKEEAISRCATPYTDMLKSTDEEAVTSILDGDTGASRVALRILKTNTGEHVVVLGYEETKGLSENLIADKDQGESDTNIELEGKAVYFESFLFNALEDFDPNDETSITKVAMPLVSAGKIVNVRVPSQDDPTKMIYENARRLVIGTHVDDSNVGTERTFVFLYKQSFETQGSSSDMFIRVNNGFTYDSFVPLDGRVVTNVSAQNAQTDVTAAGYTVDWTSDNLDDNTYENGNENTFSPRIFLRGNNIYTGFAYTPDDAKTKQDNMPSNFHIHRYLSGMGWQGPQNITGVTKASSTTVDARFFTTAQGSCGTTGLDSDKSNPDILFVSWGNIDEETVSDETVRTESDVFFKRSLNNGVDWTEEEKLAARETIFIEEKEVESLASADGNTFFNVWLQEEEEYDSSDPFSGLDSWFGRVDFE